MRSLLDLIKALYGSKAISSALGTRTNVVRLPTGKLQRYLSEDLNIEMASDNAALNAYKEMQQLIPDLPKMNDGERLVFEGNLRRLKNKLEASDLIPKQKVLKEGEVVKMETKEQVTGKGLEELIQKQGTVNPPTTIAGQLESQAKKLEKVGEDLKEVTEQKSKSVIGDIMKDYGKFQKVMQDARKTGYVRATVRQIMREDIQAGKLKLPKELQDQVMQGGGEPIDIWRKVYGEGALEQIDSIANDLGQLRTEEEAAKLARSKFTFEPDINRPPGSYTPEEEGSKGLDYLTGQEPPEKKADGGRVGMFVGGIPSMIRDMLFKVVSKPSEPPLVTTPIIRPEDEILMRYREYMNASKPSQSDLENKYRELVQGKADGGRIGFKVGGGKKILDLIAEANKKLKGKKSMETVNPKTGEVTTPTEPVKVAEEPRTLGGLPIEERSANISDEIDKLRASGINSLENEKKLNRLSLEFVDSLDPRRANKSLDFRRKSLDTENKLIIKAEEEGLDFDTYEKLRQGLYGSGKQKTLDFIKTGKVDLEPLKPVTTFEEAQKRFKTAAKAADEIFPDYNQPKTAATSLAEVMAEQKYGKVIDDLSGDQQQELYEEAYNYITSVNKLPKQSPATVPEQVLEAEMNRVLNQYDKSMFIKNEQGLVDVTNEKNQRMMAELLKRDHPELYNRIYNLGEDLSQKQILDEFDITGRKPNAVGGRVGYAEGGDAPSITLDSHKDNRLKPTDPLSKYKSYSEEELLGNIEAKRPNQLQSFSLEEYQLNTMPMIKPKDIVPKGTTNTMPIEEFLKRRYQLDLAKGGSVGLDYLMGK